MPNIIIYVKYLACLPVIYCAVPSPPKDLKVIKLNVSAILLSWSPPTSPNGILLEYKVIYLGYKSSKDMPLDVSSNDKARITTYNETQLQDKDVSIEDGPYDLLIAHPETSVQLKGWVSNLTYTFIVSSMVLLVRKELPSACYYISIIGECQDFCWVWTKCNYYCRHVRQAKM